MKKVLGVLVSGFLMFLITGCGGGGGGGGSTPPPVPHITDINGGISGSGTVNSLFIIDGTGFGTLSGATAGYSVDFREATTDVIVASATVDYAAGAWNDFYIKGIVPGGLTAGTIYKVTVTTAGGTSNAVNFLVVASVSYSPSSISWSATSSLPAAQQGFPTIVAPVFRSMTSVPSNYIYALGGNNAPTSTTAGGNAYNVGTVYYNEINNADGNLKNASWSQTTPLPARGFAAAVLANRFNSLVSGYGTIYMLGGLDGSGNATNTVYYASLNSDGTIPASGAGTWNITTALPKALFAEGAVIFHGRIYVVGGNDSSRAPVKTVYSAKINSDGTLGAWQTLTDMPIALAYHQLVTAGGYLYAIGGDSSTTAVDPLTNVPGTTSGTIYYAQINLLDGTLVNVNNVVWTQNPNGPKAREKFTAVVAGSSIVVTGGLYNGASSGSSESQYAAIDADGSIASFGGATGSNTFNSIAAYNPYNQSTAYFVDDAGKPHIFILGGADVTTGTPHLEAVYQH